MASKHMTDLTKVSSISDTDLLLVETSNGTRTIEKSDSDTNLQDQIDSISSSLNELNNFINIALKNSDLLEETALKLRSTFDTSENSCYNNLIYGYWKEGISFYQENCVGAPTASAGIVLVLKADSNDYYFTDSIFYKWAFTFDGELYLITQDANGNVLKNWKLVNLLSDGKEYTFILQKPANKVYNNSFYAYTIPFLNADRYNVSISKVIVEGMGDITSSCSISKTHPLGVDIKDISTNGNGLPITVHLYVS